MTSAVLASESHSDLAGRLPAALAFVLGVAEDRICGRYGERATEAARTFRRESLLGVIATHGRTRLGGSKSRDPVEVLEAAQRFDATIDPEVAAGYSTLGTAAADVGGLLAAEAFDANAFTAKRIARWIPAPSFQGFTAFRWQGGALQPLGPDGEIRSSGLVDAASASMRVSTVGDSLAITRNAIVADDVGAIRELFASYGRRSAQAVERALFASAILEASDVFYTSGRGNRLTTSALSLTNLGAAAAALAAMREPNGQLTMARPAFVLAPPGLAFAAAQIFAGIPIEERPAVLSSPMMADALIPGSSATTWYLGASPDVLPAWVVGTLRNQQAPTVEQNKAFSAQLGISLRGYFDFGVAQLDYRGAIKATA